jgi:hypothetical protein
VNDTRGATKRTAKKAAGAAPAAASAEARTAELLAALANDRLLAPIVRAFEESRSAGGRRSFGSNGLKAGGKLFALFTQGTLVVKLPAQRVAALVAEGVGKPFDPGHGRLMKGWLTVVSPGASWVDLAKEAHAHVAG